jgi:hypothetical protein
MSMTCWVLGVTPAQIAELGEDPDLTSDLVWVVEDDYHKALRDRKIRRMKPAHREEFLAERAAVAALPRAMELNEHISEARESVATLWPLEQAISLGRLWNILHYLFTGQLDPPNPPGDMLLTGEDVGEDLSGYGPARLHGPAPTRDFSRFLDMQDLEGLQARIDPAEMRRLGVYATPGLGSDAHFGNDLLRHEVAFHFPRLRDYVRRTSDKGNGLLVWID